jgi:hypothetical protein
LEHYRVEQYAIGPMEQNVHQVKTPRIQPPKRVIKNVGENMNRRMIFRVKTCKRLADAGN